MREQGLRKDALESIDRLIADASSWPSFERRRFVAWIYDTQEQLPEVHQLIVETLRQKLILPALEDWHAEVSGNSTPTRLLGMATGKVEYFEDALKLDADDDYSRYRLVSRLLYDVDFQCHHLPDYFIGEPAKALDDLKTARDLANQFRDSEIKDSLVAEFTELTSMVIDWNSFVESSHDSFAGWCDANNRNYNWC